MAAASNTNGLIEELIAAVAKKAKVRVLEHRTRPPLIHSRTVLVSGL
jgi:hypothetical protein